MRRLTIRGLIVAETDADIVSELRRMADHVAAGSRIGPILSEDQTAEWELSDDGFTCPACGCTADLEYIEAGHMYGHCDTCGERDLCVPEPEDSK